ncbi:MAG: ATP-binding protein [Anaerolineae bacterium]
MEGCQHDFRRHSEATSRSSFYKERFYRTHMRINLDMLKSRHREGRSFCARVWKTQQAFVVDNTNTTIKTRSKYVELVKSAGFKLIDLLFLIQLTGRPAAQRSRQGEGTDSDAGVIGMYNRLQQPSYSEGFNELYYVKLTDSGFIVREWRDEIR